MSKPSKSREEVEAELAPDQRSVFKELIDDYDAAKELHVPNFPGRANPKIIAELVKSGWRKSN